MYHSGGDVDHEGVHACVGAGDIWEIFLPFFQFNCETKNTLFKSPLQIHFYISNIKVLLEVK